MGETANLNSQGNTKAQWRWKGSSCVSVISFPSPLPQPGSAHAKATPSVYITLAGARSVPQEGNGSFHDRGDCFQF